ncbi:MULTISPECIES: hypothetical protein [Bradyrhizobium]|jgi:hypothetical protein|uniref:hypothetical protein n=1 Tax=Bradyrhizobium TaxID=374 RepID=UPI000416DCB3|nr:MULTISPECIES: hypothetical protein [Bradyrhizobium]AUC99171.1 hypothetical protein CWS35_36700 [Bradyrhizobium sp. SK17]KIU51816.1 membrane protein [Bradyrhizobium elkanii]OCX28444.1 hypothetical protein QU42_25695 [Bradyrhizobium sp. UASWS1016]
MVAHRSLNQIFAVPLVIAIVSTVGLISALVGDGWWDAVSWVALGLPVLLYLLYIWRRRPN